MIEQMLACLQANEVAEYSSEFTKFSTVETRVCLEPCPQLSFDPHTRDRGALRS